jgi:hypothetical protein
LSKTAEIYERITRETGTTTSRDLPRCFPSSPGGNGFPITRSRSDCFQTPFSVLGAFIGRRTNPGKTKGPERQPGASRFVAHPVPRGCAFTCQPPIIEFFCIESC